MRDLVQQWKDEVATGTTTSGLSSFLEQWVETTAKNGGNVTVEIKVPVKALYRPNSFGTIHTWELYGAVLEAKCE